MKNDKSAFFLKRLGTGVCIMFLVILAVPAYAAGKGKGGKADGNSHFIQVEKTENDSYISETYRVISETERELVKTFCETKTEDGVSVRITGFRDGKEEVLMDCRYDTIRFPYFFERCSDYNKNIFYEFYTDDPVWEKTVREENSNKTYTLSYAWRIQNGGEDSEKAAGYEGHLWVTDENGKIVKRLVWQSEAPYKKVSWKRSGLHIEYADGSDRTCTQSELLKDPVEAVYERCMEIDFSVKEHPMDTEKYDKATDQEYKAAYYRALSGQDSQIVFFMEDADYKPHKENTDHWRDAAYWVYTDEELGMVQVDEARYREMTRLFMEAVDYAVPAKEFDEIFGNAA